MSASRLLVTILLAAAPALASCGSASTEGMVCAAAGVCGPGRACIAARCRPNDASPSPADAQRVVLAPRDLAVLSSRDSGSALPDAVALGRWASGTVVLLLRFEASWRDDAEIASAFLVFDPEPGAAPPQTTTILEAARILEPWSSATVSWGRQPRLGLPESAGVVRATPSRVLRVDVTRWVRDWGKRLADDHGIALLASGDDVTGGVYPTGLGGGSGPRLEAYVR